MTTTGTRAWTHPGTGETRHYIADLPAALGLEVDWYKSGNIRSAALSGRGISNAAAGRLTRARAWYDAAGALHIDYLDRRAPLTRDEIADRIRTTIPWEG